MDKFWAAIEEQLTELKDARTPDSVIEILRKDRIPGHSEAGSGEGFFAGSGGDGTVLGSLLTAGWVVHWMEASYYYVLKAPDDGGFITYCEGDVDRGDLSPKAAPASRARWFVARDGVRVSPLLKSSDAASKFIQDHQGMSVDWATRWEGWRIAGPYELQAEHTYGTDDVAKQEEIEAARIDAGFARSKARETRKAQ